MNDFVFVAPSSVAPNGIGLYAARDIPAGTRLPGDYAGTRLTEHKYEALLRDLDQFALRPPQASRENVDKMRYLQDTYAMSVIEATKVTNELDALLESVMAPRNTQKRVTRSAPNPVSVRKGMYKWYRPVFDSAAPKVLWANVLQAVKDYAFEHGTYSSEQEAVTILPLYSTDGQVIFNLENPANPYVFMNEPPPCVTFLNQITRQHQASSANISADVIERNGENHVGFSTMDDIRAGDELFICYGMFYDRGYDINMSKQTGCGRYNIIGSGYLRDDVTREEYESALHVIDLAQKRYKTRIAAEYFDDIDEYNKQSVPFYC